MLRQEERATVSLRSFGSLIRVAGRKARIEEAQIDSILNELKKGNYQRLAEFEKLVDDLLNNILENIKIYAQRDGNKKIEMIYQFLSEFFNYHFFDALDNKTIHEIKSEFNKDLKQLISDLRQEKRDERIIRHGRKPIHTIFKRMFRSNRSLDRKLMREGRKEIGLENEEEGIKKSLKQLLVILTKEKSKLSRSQVNDLNNRAKVLLLRFAKIVLQEFEAIHETEVDVETQEADLIDEIKEVMKKAKGDQKVYNQLQAIIAKIQSHLKTDFYVARRMLHKAEFLDKAIDRQLEGLEKADITTNELKLFGHDSIYMIDLAEYSLRATLDDNSARVAAIIMYGEDKEGGKEVIGFNASRLSKDDRHAETDVVIKCMKKGINPKGTRLYVGDLCCIKAVHAKEVDINKYEIDEVLNKWKHHEKGKEIIFEYNSKTTYKKIIGGYKEDTVYIEKKISDQISFIYMIYDGYLIPREIHVKVGSGMYIINGCSVMVSILGIREVIYIRKDKLYGGKYDVEIFMEKGLPDYLRMNGIEDHTHHIRITQIENERLEKMIDIAKEKDSKEIRNAIGIMMSLRNKMYRAA